MVEDPEIPVRMRIRLEMLNKYVSLDDRELGPAKMDPWRCLAANVTISAIKDLRGKDYLEATWSLAWILSLADLFLAGIGIECEPDVDRIFLSVLGVRDGTIKHVKRSPGGRRGSNQCRDGEIPASSPR